MVFEGLILIPAIYLVIISIKNYEKNRSKLSLLLFLILLSYCISIAFSWCSKIISTFFDIRYLEVQEIESPGTPISWLLLRISYFRFTFVCINLAILFSFELKKTIFGKIHSKYYIFLIYAFAGFNIVFSIICFSKNLVILDVIVFLIAFSFECIVYIPFFMESLKNYETSNNPNFKHKFLNLMIMSLSFILVLLFLFLDRLLIFLGSEGYSLFYFISWIFVIAGILNVYLGYLQ